MNILTTFVLLLMSISLSTKQQNMETSFEAFHVERPYDMTKFTVNNEAYTLHFKLENKDNQKPTLVIAIELHNGSRFISPNAKRDFKGKFYMDLGSYTHLDFKDNIIESPLSIEEFDPHPYTNGLVNWVDVNTVYKQALDVKTQEDFEVFGRLQFTIEPRCTFEEIPFLIIYKNGAMYFGEPKC